MQRPKRDKTIKDLFNKPQLTQQTDAVTQKTETGAIMGTEGGEPITKAFLESLFGTLQDDIQSLKQEIKAELKEVRRDMEAIGERVGGLVSKSDDHDVEMSSLQQEVLRNPRPAGRPPNPPGGLGK